MNILKLFCAVGVHSPKYVMLKTKFPFGKLKFRKKKCETCGRVLPWV